MQQTLKQINFEMDQLSKIVAPFPWPISKTRRMSDQVDDQKIVIAIESFCMSRHAICYGRHFLGHNSIGTLNDSSTRMERSEITTNEHQT